MGLLMEVLGFGVASVFVLGLVGVPAFGYWLYERDTEFPSEAERRRARRPVLVGAALGVFGLEFAIAGMLWDVGAVLSLGYAGSVMVGTTIFALGAVPAFFGYMRVVRARQD